MTQKKFLRIEEVCEMTGFTKGYIYQLVYEKKIPHYKPTSRTLFFKESEINEWIEGCKVNAIN